MEEIIAYRNRSFTKQDIAAIRGIITSHPAGSRRFISQEVCRELNWRQTNGVLKDMVCRSFLLLLEAKGLIKLPPRKQIPPNPLARRLHPTKVGVDQTLLESSLKDLLPIRLEPVRRTPMEKVFNSLVHERHYLGYAQPVGGHLKYIAFSHNRPISCLASYLLALSRRRLSQDWKHLYRHPIHLVETFVDPTRFQGRTI